jgi:hypothetical protein
MFVCMAMSAVHVEFMDTYSTRGVLLRIQSDRGEQLVTASKQISAWNFEGIQEWAEERASNGI